MAKDKVCVVIGAGDATGGANRLGLLPEADRCTKPRSLRY